MGYLIDSGVFIAVERGTVKLDHLAEQAAGENLFMSVVTLSELWHGVHRADTLARAARRAAAIEKALKVVPVLDIGSGIARRHAALWAELASKGDMIGIHDSWIAATALHHDLVVVTRNVREFHRVPGLSHEVW